MKKKMNFRLMAMVTLVAATLASCGDDSPSNEPSQPVTPVTPTTDNAMTPDEQKSRLEQVALEFMDLTPSSDFEQIADLGDYMRNNYGENYDWESVGEWAIDLWTKTRKAVGTSSDQDRWGYNYVYTNYEAVILASNFTGHFTASNGKWVRTDASDLQFIFNDQKGQQCVLSLVTSGNVKRVHAFDIEEYDHYEGSTEYYDRTQNTVGVPENVVVMLTQGGKQVLKTSVTIDLNSITDNEFNLTKGNITASVTQEFNNGYRIAVSQVAYTAGTQASASCVVTKNGKTLVTAAAAGSLSDIPDCNVSAFSASNFDIDNYDTESANSKSPYVKLDILGKVQIQGKVSDVRKFVDYLNKADDSSDTESTFKSYINQANSLLDVNIFYDGTATKQASVRLEPFVEDSWNGRTYWTAEPVICFFDGSSYSTFEAFFNDTDFKNTIDSFKRLANRYAGLVGESIDW